LYDRAVAQVARLQAGAVQYKAVDLGYRPGTALNCIHAVSDIDPDNGLLETGTDYGDEATYLVAHHLMRWLINPYQVHECVYDRLGLRGLPIPARTWGRAPGSWW